MTTLEIVVASLAVGLVAAWVTLNFAIMRVEREARALFEKMARGSDDAFEGLYEGISDLDATLSAAVGRLRRNNDRVFECERAIGRHPTYRRRVKR